MNFGLKGFTLLEIMVALVIVAVVFVASFYSLSEMTKNTRTLKEKTLAGLIANNEIILFKKANQGQKNMSKKSHTMGNNTFYSTISTKPTSEAGVEEIQVIVENNQGATVATQVGYLYVGP